MPSVKVWVKKRVVLGKLSFTQRQMYKLGVRALEVFQNRTFRAITPEERPAKPLTPGYARLKKRWGFSGLRDLHGPGKFAGRVRAGQMSKAAFKRAYPGHMMDALRPTSVTEGGVKAGFTTQAAKLKAWANEQREKFMAWSASDIKAIFERARELFVESVDRVRKSQ